MRVFAPPADDDLILAGLKKVAGPHRMTIIQPGIDHFSLPLPLAFRGCVNNDVCAVHRLDSGDKAALLLLAQAKFTDASEAGLVTGEFCFGPRVALLIEEQNSFLSAVEDL